MKPLHNPFSNRRTFLTSSTCAVGALALPTIVHSKIFGADAASNKIALGCIGVGGMGTSNLKKFLDQPDVQVIAVCDVSPENRLRAKQLVDTKYGNSDCVAVSDFRDLIGREDIDAVSIAAPDHWNAFLAIAAAKAGKDMYCEKPMGVSVEQSQAIKQAIRKHNRVFQAGTWQRSQAHFHQVCQAVRSGALGKIHTVEVSTDGPQFKASYIGPRDVQPAPAPPEGFDWEMWQGPAPLHAYHPARHSGDWFLINDYSNGFIVNWGVHHLDIALWGMPELGTVPFEVECKASYRDKGFTDNVNQWHAVFSYENGLKLIFKDQYQMKTGCRFYGEHGWAHTDRPGSEAAPKTLLAQQDLPAESQLYVSTHHQADFIQCVRSRKDPVSNVDATHTASCLGMLADIAARLEMKLTWDPKTERFRDNAAANAMLQRTSHNNWTLT